MRLDWAKVIDGYRRFNSRTPHGVRLAVESLQHTSYCFNSRTPHGVRRAIFAAIGWLVEFQFTHPARGATGQVYHHLQDRLVSIHAPRTGCDRCALCSLHKRIGFNSRTPHGVRLRIAHRDVAYRLFQFTHPARGATVELGFSSLLQSFNSRTPHGVRLRLLKNFRNHGVSIHAPRTGCDGADLCVRPHPTKFQFTHPARGATITDYHKRK